MKKLLLLILAVTLTTLSGIAQPSAQHEPRYRVIIDNDFSGDPDGLFQLAHSLLSTSCEIRAIIGSHVGGTNSEIRAVEEINALMELMGKENAFPVYAGSPRGLVDSYTPARSAGAQAIIDEAMRTDTDKRLFILCGASLTTVASAYLMEPAIADKITIVWIGGQEYDGMALPPRRNIRSGVQS